MHVYKPSYTNGRRDGELRTTVRWYVEFWDHRGTRRRLAAFTDKGVSERFGRNVEALVECRKAKVRPTGDLAQWLEGLPLPIVNRLAELGLIDRARVMAGQTLQEHLDAYEAAMTGLERSAQHVEQEVAKIKRFLTECGFRYWSDITAEKVQSFLAGLRRDDDRSCRTINAYLGAFKTFCRWCVADGRAAESPVLHVKGMNARTDVRRRRRALSDDELRALLTTAQNGPREHKMPGPERAMLYRVAVETGLRWSELRSLRRESFKLTGGQLTVTVAAGYSKHRREDVLPLRVEMAMTLKEYFDVAPALTGAPAFPNMPASNRGGRMIEADLTAARTAWIAEAQTPEERERREKTDFLKAKDSGGGVVDFHALRHTFITNLARSGVHPKTAQDLARHSDINLTLSRYTHTLIEDRARAVANLPDVTPNTGSGSLRATGTDDAKVGTVACTLGPDSAGFGRTVSDSGRVDSENTPGLAGHGRNRDPQGPCDWGERRGLNPQPPEPQSGALAS